MNNNMSTSGVGVSSSQGWEMEMEMEGGMRDGNLLDPWAQEFHPATAQFVPQIYYPYPPPAVAFYTHHHLPMGEQYVCPGQVADDGSATRGVVLSMVPRGLAEGTVRAEMEAFGGVRALETRSLAGEGIVTVYFYDLRSAGTAVAEVREQHVRQQGRLGLEYGVVPWDLQAGGGFQQYGGDGGGVFFMPQQFPFHQPQPMPSGRGLIAGQAVWAQFAAKELDGPNQGSLAVLNFDPGVPSAVLREIFEAFGAVKEVRETTTKPYNKFVEFYDIRDAARALSELNGKEINGRRLVVEFSRPGGQRRSAGGGGGSSGCHKRSPSCHSMPLPPRLQRSGSTSQPNKWRSSSQSPSSSSGGSREAGGGGGPLLLKRSSNIMGSNIARSSNFHNSISSSSGRRNKSGFASSSAAAAASSSSLKQQSTRRGCKNHHKNSGESRFLFKEVGEQPAAESSLSSCRDSRTTVMIKNIPNKYSQKLLLNMLDNHCIHCNEQLGDGESLSAYDFVYLPIDFNNKCNVGYGFVNLTSPEATWRLYRAFHMQPWEVFNSRKICQVTYARLQGLEALKEHFKNSKFACDNDEYMPVVFSPPRDGKQQLTDPVPIGGRANLGMGKRLVADLATMRSSAGGSSDDAGSAAPPDYSGGASSTTTSTHAPSDNADEMGEEDDDEEEEDEPGEDGGHDEDNLSRLSGALLQLSYGGRTDVD